MSNPMFTFSYTGFCERQESPKSQSKIDNDYSNVTTIVIVTVGLGCNENNNDDNDNNKRSKFLFMIR